MKKIYLILPVLLLFVLGACSPEEYDRLDPNAIPLVSGLEEAIVITVDQETNTVTFTLDKPGYNPVWIFDDGKYAAENGVKKIFPKAGDYTVEMKASNRNGISDGSVTKTFHIDKSLMEGFAGFVYDSEYNMWKTATVNTPTFYYAPGWVQIADPAYTLNGSAYTVTLPSATTETWQAQMALGTNLSANAATHYDFSVILTSTKDHPGVMVKLTDASNDGSFFFEQKIVLEANQPTCFWMSDMPGIDMASVKLVFDFGGNVADTEMRMEDVVFKDHANDDGTVVPDRDAFDEGRDLSGSEYATGIVGKWTWEPSVQGHFGCGPNPDEPTGWWSAPAEDKKDWGLYDDTMTFGADKSYQFNPGEGGKVYVNKDCTFHSELYLGDGLDYLVPVEPQTATYTVTEEAGAYYLQLPSKTLFSYMPSDQVYNNPKYKITRMTTTMMELVSLGDGISWKYRLKKVN
ncbi:PKD domain-containing protein [uncultured Proteiniphilum sp.]|uniref:PKD domain-containing protein n=1 Tax=uncultured Proteiniphilum sp. TaxID=497637 RepID=UPI00260D5E26|nr:PKD domain-containing protein [uncultured Proteiniphilum sp.]